MTTLHLGVVDIPYVARETPAQMRKRVRKAAPRPAGQKTTGDVADILEAKYHVMEAFFTLHQDEIVKTLESSLQGSLENLLTGAPLTANPLGEGESEIKNLFSQFLTNKEMDSLGYPGVPTKAALQGESQRFKRRRNNVSRPSFVDTGLYESAFRAWID